MRFRFLFVIMYAKRKHSVTSIDYRHFFFCIFQIINIHNTFVTASVLIVKSAYTSSVRQVMLISPYWQLSSASGQYLVHLVC